MTITIKHTDETTGRTYRADMDADDVNIYEIQPGLSRHCGTGTWDGCSIQDCDAVLGGDQDAADRIYAALDSAMAYAADVAQE